ncbi:uncharacterized protein LOC120681202 [Panicum virgatum]|uniref:uncharacterized protein LOC120681202 n=1 Tax=Panicum virgatum TaxID=38727 RepID=UPI0019D5B015|nr:uncharacterized protein LOC120681202 [Panicum virgatum]
MMATKVAIQVMVFALVFIMLATHPGWGEQDCYDEKDAVIRKCMVWPISKGAARTPSRKAHHASIETFSDYVDPSNICRATVQESDMACVCHVISKSEQRKISVVKLVRLARQLARQCGKPVLVGSKCGTWTVPPPLSPPSQSAHP